MTIDRRSFLYAGGLTAAAAPLATAAQAAAATGRSITDFGVEPNAERDQTQAIQKAIDELGHARQPLLFPAGVYRAKKLTILNISAMIGVPGLTVIETEEISVKAYDDLSLGFVTLSGIIFKQQKGAAAEAFFASGTNVNISDCYLSGSGKTAIKLGLSPATLQAVTFTGWSDAAIDSGSPNLVVNGCHFEKCGVGVGTRPDSVSVIANNRFNGCAIGTNMQGTATLNGNIVTGASRFGLKLGNAKGSGHILAQSNLIRDCRIGIAVASSGDDIMASLNMITGAKDGAIRAFDGDRLVGPDLASQSAEAYLNLMVAGNVVR
jgi:hypothetical protein